MKGDKRMSTEAVLPTSTASPKEGPPKKKRKLSFPTAFTILFALTIVAVAATWFVPAGQYAKLAYNADAGTLQITSPQGAVSEEPATQETLDAIGVNIGIDQFTSGALSKPISVPNTYERLEQQPKGIADITVSMVSGTVEAADIMVFILVLGGLIGVVNASGAFESGLMALTKKTKGHEFLLVFLVSALMVLGGTTCGLEEEAVAFYPILVPIFLALGYDSIICVGAIFLAGSMGTTFSTINPFSVVIASNAAGVNFTQGIEWRIAGCVVGAIVVIAYLYWYSRKIKANPAFSYTYEDREKFAKLYNVEAGETKEARATGFTLKKKAILVLFVAAFPIMVWGVVSQGWWFPQMAASFLAIAIIIMFLSGIAEKKVVDAFIHGASSLVGVSLIIGLARGINLIMEQGLISDTLLFWSSGLVQGMTGPVFILVMMLIFFLLGFVVPSSSGLAVLYAHHGAAGRHRGHPALGGGVRLPVGPIRHAVPRAHRPRAGHAHDVGHEVLQVAQVRVAHGAVRAHLRRHPAGRPSPRLRRRLICWLFSAGGLRILARIGMTRSLPGVEPLAGCSAASPSAGTTRETIEHAAHPTARFARRRTAGRMLAHVWSEESCTEPKRLWTARASSPRSHRSREAIGRSTVWALRAPSSCFWSSPSRRWRACSCRCCTTSSMRYTWDMR